MGWKLWAKYHFSLHAVLYFHLKRSFEPYKSRSPTDFRACPLPLMLLKKLSAWMKQHSFKLISLTQASARGRGMGFRNERFNVQHQNCLVKRLSPFWNCEGHLYHTRLIIIVLHFEGHSRSPGQWLYLPENIVTSLLWLVFSFVFKINYHFPGSQF